MMVRTRYVLCGGASVLIVGFLGGLVAYLEGGPSALAVAQGRPDQFRYLPAEASVVAFANVRDVMYSDFRQRFRQIQPDLDGQREFQEQTGIDIENDIDEVVACLVPNGSDEPEGLVVLSGRFDATRLEALARAQGATFEEYRGRRLVKTAAGENTVAMAFVEAGVIAIGSEPIVRRAIDLPSTGEDVTSNERLMSLLSNIESGSNAWAIGRLDDSAVLDWLPDEVETQIPQIAAFAVGGRVNGGVSGTVTAEARDDEAGQNLRDVLQGFLALARMQTSSRPELRTLLDSIQLSAAGTTVSLSFAFPPEILQQLLPEPADQDDEQPR